MLRRIVTFCLSAFLLGLGVSSCSSDEETCASKHGITCHDCSGAGDCDISCNAGELENCVGLEYFSGSNPDDLRCAFCE